MTDRLDELDYYTLLGVAEEATFDAIRDAFHKFALRYHPDQHAGTTPERVERATAIYRRGTEAYRVLADSERRRQYDQMMLRGVLRFDPSLVRRSLLPPAGPVQPSTPPSSASSLKPSSGSIPPSGPSLLPPRGSLRPSMAPLVARSAQAAPFVAKADQALRIGDFRTAKLNLSLALQREPDNAAIRDRLTSVEEELAKEPVPSKAPPPPTPKPLSLTPPPFRRK